MDESGRKDYRSLGEILRDARVKQGKSVEELSEITKIVPKSIIALEADDLDRIAGPVYARGFTRTLAEALKLDVEFLLTKLSNASPAAAPPEPIHVDPVMPKSTRIVSDSVTPLGADEKASRDETTWHIEKVRVTRVEAHKRKFNPLVLVAAAALILASVALYVLAGRGSGVTTEPPSAGSAQNERIATLDEGTQSPVNQLDDATESNTQPPEPVESKPQAPAKMDDKDGDEELVPPQETRQSTGGQRDLAGPAQQPTVAEDDPEPEAARTPTPPEDEELPPGREEQDDARDAAPPQEEEVSGEQSGGLGSIVRPDADKTVKPLRTLRLSSMEEVEIWAAADGDDPQRHILRRGSSVTLEGRDHFSLKMDDPSSVIVVLDGVRRDPPPGHSGEWIIWADESQR